MNTHSDVEITCQDCLETFIWTARDQKFYEDQEYDPPKRCPTCRQRRKADRRQEFFKR